MGSRKAVLGREEKDGLFRSYAKSFDSFRYRVMGQRPGGEGLVHRCREGRNFWRISCFRPDQQQAYQGAKYEAQPAPHHIVAPIADNDPLTGTVAPFGAHSRLQPREP
jgi:hypothetical protein